MYLVNHLSTKEEKNELEKTFHALDINGDGKLSREELIIGTNHKIKLKDILKF